MRIAARLAVGIVAALLTCVAFATSPTLTGNGYTAANEASGVVTFNIGSPASGTLAVLAFACFDIASSDTLAVVTPSGWTKEIERTGSFSTQALLWKVASGSEGATLTVTVGTFTSQCGAWYFKFTGYDTTNPIDATDIPWNTFSFTQDPPSITVASGPLDVYAVAFATDRGDNSYVSGSDLTTNVHADKNNDGSISLGNGRLIEISHGAYTALSSKDPGTFTTTGGGSRANSAMTFIVYPPSSGLPKKPLCGPLCGALQGPLQ